MTEKPVVEVRINGIDFVAMESDDQGDVIVLFTTDAAQELAIRMSPQVVAELEDKLNHVREKQAGKRPSQ